MVNPTDTPLWQAARPSPSATCVLPVPLLPSAMTVSRRSMDSPRASSRTSALLSEGTAGKSKLSRLLTVGKCAARMRRADAPLHHPPLALDQLQLGQAQEVAAMSDAPQVLLAHHLKALKLPTFLREHDKLDR